MKKIMPHVAGVFFSLFGLGVIALLMSYTFEALAFIFPDNFISQMMGMVLFDIAALAWLAAFIYLCKSIMQYAFAIIGFVFGLLGSLAMVAIDVMLGGQEMIEAPAWINEALIYGFIAAAVVHVILVYAYKLAGPEISADISLGIETANITEEAMKQAEDELLRERGAMGRVIAPRLMNNVRRNLGLPVSNDVIDLPAYDVPDQSQAIPVQIPARRSMSFIERVKAAGKVLIDPMAVASNPHTYQAETNSPTPITDTLPTSAAQQADSATPGPTDLHYHPMSEPIRTEEKKPLPEIFRGDPIVFKSAISTGSQGAKINVGDELQAILCEDGMYNISEPNATYAIARLTADDFEYWKTGVLVEETPPAKNFQSYRA